MVALGQEELRMTVPTNRKSFVRLEAAVLDQARDLGINVTAVAEAALRRAVAEASRQAKLTDNVAVAAAQSDWQARTGHPLAEIMIGPGAVSRT